MEKVMIKYTSTFSLGVRMQPHTLAPQLEQLKKQVLGKRRNVDTRPQPAYLNLQQCDSKQETGKGMKTSGRPGEFFSMASTQNKKTRCHMQSIVAWIEKVLHKVPCL